MPDWSSKHLVEGCGGGKRWVYKSPSQMGNLNPSRADKAQKHARSIALHLFFVCLILITERRGMVKDKAVTRQAQSDNAKEIIEASGIQLWLELAK